MILTQNDSCPSCAVAVKVVTVLSANDGSPVGSEMQTMLSRLRSPVWNGKVRPA